MEQLVAMGGSDSDDEDEGGGRKKSWRKNDWRAALKAHTVVAPAPVEEEDVDLAGEGEQAGDTGAAADNLILVAGPSQVCICACTPLCGSRPGSTDTHRFTSLAQHIIAVQNEPDLPLNSFTIYTRMEQTLAWSKAAIHTSHWHDQQS